MERALHVVRPDRKPQLEILDRVFALFNGRDEPLPFLLHLFEERFDLVDQRQEPTHTYIFTLLTKSSWGAHHSLILPPPTDEYLKWGAIGLNSHITKGNNDENLDPTGQRRWPPSLGLTLDSRYYYYRVSFWDGLRDGQLGTS